MGLLVHDDCSFFVACGCILIERLCVTHVDWIADDETLKLIHDPKVEEQVEALQHDGEFMSEHLKQELDTHNCAAASQPSSFKVYRWVLVPCYLLCPFALRLVPC